MDMKSICRNQVDEAKKHKWIMGQKLGYDPGEKAIEDWVKNHAKEYREEYVKCLNCLISKVFNSTKSEIKKIDPNLSDDVLLKIETMIIENFTLVWIKECAINEGDKHIKEI